MFVLQAISLFILLVGQTESVYVEIDHTLIPRNIEDINERTELSGSVKKEHSIFSTRSSITKKYEVKKGNIQDVFLAFELNKVNRKNEYGVNHGAEYQKKISVDVKTCEPVIGPSEDIFYDEDFGFFSAILACYNNHWVLRTSPDDWWNVIVKNVAQAVDDNGSKETVRKLFVDHNGTKEIKIIVGSLASLDYNWLFDQFSEAIRQNIKTPGYVDLMQADFSTTTQHQLISSQVMIMSSLQKYFSYSYGTACGIPGVDMKGTTEDWEKLIKKMINLEKLLEPVMEDIKLGIWFKSAKIILNKLLDTFNDSPDKKWWGNILSWHEWHGSGARSWWEGWMIDFLRAKQPENPGDFQSGTVSVPVHIFENGGPEDDGLLVAGTVGYTVNEATEGRAPTVEAKQGWVLLLPRHSPITPFLTGG